jgi:hypothetical protein
LSSAIRVTARHGDVGRPADDEMAGPGDDGAAGSFLRFAAPTTASEEAMSNPSLDRGSDLLRRFAPLAGVLYAGLTAAGDLVIGEFPDGSTSGAQLRDFYAGHGAHVALGGALFEWAAVCFAVFGIALWSRARQRPGSAVVAALVLVGVVLETGAQSYDAGVFQFLGEHGADGHIAPAALQAWQLPITEIGTSGGLVLFVIGIAVAAFGHRALPRWIAGAAAVLVAAGFTPVSFVASLVFLLWAAVAGVALAVRPVPRPVAARDTALSLS